MVAALPLFIEALAWLVAGFGGIALAAWLLHARHHRAWQEFARTNNFQLTDNRVEGMRLDGSWNQQAATVFLEPRRFGALKSTCTVAKVGDNPEAYVRGIAVEYDAITTLLDQAAGR